MAYIKKEPIVEFITKGLNNPDKDKAFGHDAIEILTEIEYMPIAEVEEVRHGEWKLMDTEKFMDGSYSSKFFCSKCLREIGVCHEHESDNHKYAKLMYPYCHCGAKMNGRSDTNG